MRNALRRKKSPEKNKRSHLRNLVRRAERRERAFALLPVEQRERMRAEFNAAEKRREARRREGASVEVRP